MPPYVRRFLFSALCGAICLPGACSAQSHTAQGEYRTTSSPADQDFITCYTLEGDSSKGRALFPERFDDGDLTQRGWYDGTRLRMVGDAAAGKGCIEYEWSSVDAPVSGSSAMRHLFEPTDEVAIRSISQT